MNIPYTKKRHAQFRGPTTSDDFNNRTEEYYRDLVTLTNRAELSEIETEETRRRILNDHMGLSTLIQDLRERIESLELGETRVGFFSGTQIDNARFDNQPLYKIESVDRLSFDSTHGLLTLPKVDVSSLSKLFFVNSEGDGVVPPSLEMRVVGTNTTADWTDAVIDESPPELSVYRRPGMVWERNVIVNSINANGAEMTVYVKVPTDLFTTDKSNTILIHPYPLFSTTIRDISYTVSEPAMLDETTAWVNLNSGASYLGEAAAVGHVAPGGWTGVHTGTDAIVGSGPKLFHFPAKSITAFRIRLHQPRFVREDADYVYSYGISRLDLRYDKFLKEGRAMIRIDAPVGQTISNIDGDDVQPQIWNVPRPLLGDVFSYRVIWETAPDSGTYTTTPVPNSSRVWIEVTLKMVDDYVPSLSGLTVGYT